MHRMGTGAPSPPRPRPTALISPLVVWPRDRRLVSRGRLQLRLVLLRANDAWKHGGLVEMSQVRSVNDVPTHGRFCDNCFY